MKFLNLTLCNFSSYGENVPPIDLSVTEEKPLVIFIGDSGFGKTSLFDAINWALYGADYERDLLEKKDRGILDYVHENSLKDAYQKKQRVEMSVKLTFEHTEAYEPFSTTRYIITQVLQINPIQKADGKFTAEHLNRNTMLWEVKPLGDHVEIPYTRQFLDEILPNNVKSYFLFDGDRIHNLAKPGNSKEVEQAIYRVVDLEIIRNAANHLEDAASEYSKKASKAATGELAEIEAKYEEELNFQSGIKRELIDIKNERQSLRALIDLIEAKLRELDTTSALQAKRDQVKKDIESNDKNQREAKSRLRDAAAKASFKLAMPAIQGLKNVLREKREKGEIPKHLKETFFNDLFAIKRCICGTPFERVDSDPIYKKLKERLESEKSPTEDENKLIDLLYDLGVAEELISEEAGKVVNEEKLVFELEKADRALRIEKTDLDKQLEDASAEDSAVLVTNLKKHYGDDQAYAEKNIKLVKDLELSDARLETIKNKRDELGKMHKEASSLHLRSDLSERAARKLYELYDEFAEKSRAEVEQLTIEEFRKFIKSSSGYHVSLNKEYSLEVLDSNNNKALQRLSMGQSQCLSLSFITAIARVSEKHPPLVIDMPFSRLDYKVHGAVSERLPKLSKQTVLFLLSDTEWNRETKGNLTQFANHIYEMSFDEELRQTSITPKGM